MQLSRDELLLILAAFDFKEFADLSQRLEAFLLEQAEDDTFTLCTLRTEEQMIAELN